MNVTDIKGQVLKSIPMPVVSLPTEWVDAIDWAKSVVTCDRAKSFYSKAWLVTKWTARAAWNVILVLIGLAMLAIDAWQNRKDINSSSAALLYARVSIKLKQAANIVSDQAVFIALYVRDEGLGSFESKVIAPAVVVRDRVKASLQVMVQGKEI